MMSSMKEMLLQAPDGQLDACMHPLISKWDENPTSLQILEVLDHCIYGALASGFVVTVLQSLYDSALQKEGKTHAQNEALATWRNRT
jgi:hypothetical protein